MAPCVDPAPRLLPLLLLGAAGGAAAGAGAGAGASSPPSALQAARALVPPAPTAAKDGEFEGYEFWEEHDELLQRAWRELGPRRAELYTFGPTFESRYVHGELRRAADRAREAEDEAPVRSLFDELYPGVYATDRLFTPAFMEDLLQELQHIQTSGIPQRRPNGMNRYGVILDQVGMESAIHGLAGRYLAPLAGALFPELVGPTDAEEHYAFTVKYEPGGDTKLAKHGDASVVTINLCLGEVGWRGGELEFFASDGSGLHAPSSAGGGNVTFHPGMAVVHRGQHKHQALPLLDGQRTNVIIWLMGRHETVRVAPYPPSEQLSVRERWSPPHVRKEAEDFQDKDREAWTEL